MKTKNASKTNTRSRLVFFAIALTYNLLLAIYLKDFLTHSDRREQCLNIFGNVNGIDIFRLYNICDIMNKIHSKVDELLTKNDKENTIQVYDDKLKEVLRFQIKEIGDGIKEIAQRCENAKNDINPKI